MTLPPDLKRLAADIMAQGRYSNLDDAVRAAVGLLRRAETERAAFIVSLREAEAERDGFSKLDKTLQETDEIIAAAELRHG